MPLLLLFLVNLDIGGYIDNRPFLGFSDSIIFSGFTRGLVDMKTDQEIYGAYAAIDLMIPFDTSIVQARNTIEIPRLAAWVGNYNLRATLGRQLVNWSTSRVFKCLDFFNAVNYLEPGYERSGINAIQASWTFSHRGSIRLLCKPLNTFDESFYAGRLATNLLKNDIGINTFYQNNPVLKAAGLDLGGELIFGYWAEAVSWQNDSAEHFKSTIGIDYTLPLSVYLMAEYFHDASGQSDPLQYDFTLIYDDLRSTLARDYLYINAGITPNVLFRPGISAIINLNDRGTTLIPNIFYALYDNVDLNVGANIAFGDAASEFKNINPYDAVVYLWLKAYF